MNSRGSRNWSQKEQREILRTGKCHGYEGQHMLSVKEHPEHAGNEKNIQFLTHEEHFKAHQGNWKNDANGKYNLRTGKVEPFADGTPNIKYRKLSDPISDRSKKVADNRYQQSLDKQTQQAKSVNTMPQNRSRLPVNKTNVVSTENKMSRSRNMFNERMNLRKASVAKKDNNLSKSSHINSRGRGQGT